MVSLRLVLLAILIFAGLNFLVFAYYFFQPITLISASLDNFPLLLAENSGVYNYDALSKYPQTAFNSTLLKSKFSNTILIVSFNFAYLELFYNWMCSTTLQNSAGTSRYKFIVAAQDVHLYNYCKSNKIPVFLIGNIGTSSSTFREALFNKISALKISSVKKILQYNYNVLFTDVDVAFAKGVDPFQYFSMDSMLEIQSNAINSEVHDMFQHEFNSGFYYIKSNQLTIDMLTDVKDLSEKKPTFDDQFLWVEVVRRYINENRAIKISNENSNLQNNLNMVTIRILDIALFPNGAVYFYDTTWLNELLKVRNVQPVMCHANYLVGKDDKIARLKEKNQWHVSNKASECAHE